MHESGNLSEQMIHTSYMVTYHDRRDGKRKTMPLEANSGMQAQETARMLLRLEMNEGDFEIVRATPQ